MNLLHAAIIEITIEFNERLSSYASRDRNPSGPLIYVSTQRPRNQLRGLCVNAKCLSTRQVGIESGLDRQVIRRLKEVQAKRPNMTYCILLTHYFGVNPNEFLQLAGWPTLKVFDIKSASIDNLPPEAVDVALDIARIPDLRTRKRVAEAVRVLLKKYFN